MNPPRHGSVAARRKICKVPEGKGLRQTRTGHKARPPNGGTIVSGLEPIESKPKSRLIDRAHACTFDRGNAAYSYYGGQRQ
jgi:hypothetical protein